MRDARTKLRYTLRYQRRAAPCPRSTGRFSLTTDRCLSAHRLLGARFSCIETFKISMSPLENQLNPNADSRDVAACLTRTCTGRPSARLPSVPALGVPARRGSDAATPRPPAPALPTGLPPPSRQRRGTTGGSGFRGGGAGGGGPRCRAVGRAEGARARPSAGREALRGGGADDARLSLSGRRLSPRDERLGGHRRLRPLPHRHPRYVPLQLPGGRRQVRRAAEGGRGSGRLR